MSKRALDFIEIPTRSNKPRTKGLTLARDYGIGFNECVDWVESVGQFIDYVKMRHIFTLLAENNKQDLLVRKVKYYRDNNINVNPGGIVYEMAFLSNKVDETFGTLTDMGFNAVEISENIVPLTIEDKVNSVKLAKSHGLKVMFEVGEKYPDGPLDVNLAESDINYLLDAGADLVILERSVIEILLGQKGEGSEAHRLVDLVNRIGLDPIVFEAEAIPHQAWLFNTFGPDVNIGPNLEPNYIAKLEATRRTLSREGGYTWMTEKVKNMIKN